MITHYKHLKIVNFAGTPSNKEIKAIEAQLGTALPDDFRAFVEVANGGYLPYLINVPPTPDGEPIGFCSVFSTKPNKLNEFGYRTFIGELRAIPKRFEIPKKVLPFATDGGGSTVYLDLTEEGKGRVVAFVHGLPAWTGLRQEDAFVEIAPNFSTFVDLLYLDPEDDWTE
jgi:hypothetical protein